MRRFLLGIDLGTTNSALAYVDRTARLRHGRPALETYAIPQLVAAGEVQPRNLLPSFLYRPGPHDLPAGATALPWNPDGGDVVGEFARQQGARVPGRLVSSAKSWLCHPGVDRTVALLPFGAPPEVPRMSPLAASADYLAHLRNAWDNGRPAGERIADSSVVLTVPASFDDVARTLTVEAAKLAGLPDVTLLEEPQAAFYCWLALAGNAESAQLKPGMNCLVIDVGGGTSDFSLIQSVEQNGELHFVREAVGDHLLLGGDNMDLALARYAEGRLPGGRVDPAQFVGLVQACRHAKEVMLAPDAPERHTVAILGRGRSVIGGSLAVTLERHEVRAALFDGFFPTCRYGDEPGRGARGGLHEMGLPYVHDPAITRHMASFLRRHLGERAPDAVLFNGGVFQPQSLRDHLLNVMRGWYPTGWQPLVLTTPSLDLAVAWGAAYYGYVKATGGKIIGGGTARSYYVGVSNDAADGSLPVLCVVPRHLEENQEVRLPSPVLQLTTGLPVAFPLYTSTARADDRPGQLMQLRPEQLKQLPPVHTLLRGGKRAGAGEKQVPVTLAARSTAIGTLELFCETLDRSQRWKLEFNAREEQDVEGSGAGNAFQELIPEDAIVRAGDLVRDCYTTGSVAPQELTAKLEAALEMPRGEWTSAVCRRLWEPLAEVVGQRRRSPAHFTRWSHLAGYILRPGFGDPLDRYRVDTLWKLWAAPQPGQTTPTPDAGADVWVMWRRVAGGLNQPHQHALMDRIRPFLLPGKSKNTVKPAANELAEVWRAAASLERLGANVKGQLAEVLLKQLRKPPAPSYAFWALTRLGARVLLYGPLNEVVHPDVATTWIEQLLLFRPSNQSERAGWLHCLASMTRRSGQRALDVSDGVRSRVLDVLKREEANAAWVRMVDEVTTIAGDERAALFGEALPLGLRLA